MKLVLVTLSLLALLLASCSGDQPKSSQSVELGTVSWQRDHDAALEASVKTGKPVFVLFQEVPG